MSEVDVDEIARITLDAHPVAVVVVDPRGTVVFANGAGHELFSDGQSPVATLSGWSGQRQSLGEILAAASSSSNWAPLRLLRGKREVYARARGLLSEGSGPPNILITTSRGETEPFVQHSTHLKRLNDQLASRQRAEARMEFVLEAAGIGIWEFDVLSGTTWRSDRHDAIFGYQAQLPEWTLANFLKHVVEDDRDRVRSVVEDAIAQRKSYRIQTRIVRTDGVQRWIAAEGVPSVGPEGNVVQLKGIVSDITEAKETALRVEAAERMESLGQMAGGLAHDFANIIGIIRLQAEVASLTRDDETVWARLEAIVQAANRGAELAARTLAFARREPSVAEAVAVRRLVLQIMELTFGEAIGAIEIDIAGVEEAFVHCDPGQLENALLNLTFNSRDAIQGSGIGDRITVSARPLPGDDRIEIVFTDNGPGMTKDVLERAADPFFTTKEGVGGTGLGLSSVAAFAVSTGGDFDIRSTPGAGTTVTLKLPAANPVRHDDGSPRTSPAEGDVPALRVMLVEDLAQFREAMELMLTTMGHDVNAFEKATPALQALKDGPPVDILLTDVLLRGDMNGFDLARAAADLKPELGVIYISGYADESERKGAPKGHFIRKPFDRNELLEALRLTSDILSPK